MGHEILGTQPAERGWGIPSSQGLMLGKGQPECHHLPLGIVQGFSIGVVLLHNVSSHRDPSTSPGFFPPVWVISELVHRCQDPLVGVVHRVWSPFWP